MAEPDLDAIAATWNERRSPYTAMLGIVIDALASGRATLRMPAAAMLLNEDGVVHGGALASLCDVALYVALLTLFGSAKLVTVDLAVSFLAAAPAGSDVVAEARTIKAGRTISYGDVTLRSGERIVAHAVLNFIKPDPR